MKSNELCSVQLLCALCLFFLVAQVSTGWSCVQLKWWSGSHSHASCSPVPPWLCTEGVDGIQNTSPWRFGMTGNTNYYSAASMFPLPLSFTQKETPLSLSHTHAHTHLSSAWSSLLLWPMRNVLMFRDVLCRALWQWVGVRAVGGYNVSWASLNHQGCMNMKADTMCSYKSRHVCFQCGQREAADERTRTCFYSISQMSLKHCVWLVTHRGKDVNRLSSAYVW